MRAPIVSVGRGCSFHCRGRLLEDVGATTSILPGGHMVEVGQQAPAGVVSVLELPWAALKTALTGEGRTCRWQVAARYTLLYRGPGLPSRVRPEPWAGFWG